MAEPPPADSVGGRIYALRLEAGFKTQQQLADAMTAMGHNTDRNWVTRVEGNKWRPGYEALAVLKKLLGVSAEHVMWGEGEGKGDSEFVARMRGYEGALDARGQRTVLEAARYQAAETSERYTASEIIASAFDVAAERLSPRRRRVLRALQQEALQQLQGRGESPLAQAPDSQEPRQRPPRSRQVRSSR